MLSQVIFWLTTIWPKRGKNVQNTFSTIPQLIIFCFCFEFVPHYSFSNSDLWKLKDKIILRDPGADSGQEGKSKRAEKHGMKKSKEQ